MPIQSSKRLPSWFLWLGVGLGLVAPGVLAGTLPFSGSDNSVAWVTILGVFGGISSIISAAALHARSLEVRGLTMSALEVAIWIVLAMGVGAFLGFVNASIMFARYGGII